MVKTTEKVLCSTPTPGKQGVNIEKWKYDTVRRAILKSIPRKGEGVLFSALPDLVRNNIPEKELQRLGSVTWYTTAVKLDLEVKGDIYRVHGVKPQRLLRR